jgi:predicted ATPase
VNESPSNAFANTFNKICFLPRVETLPLHTQTPQRIDSGDERNEILSQGSQLTFELPQRAQGEKITDSRTFTERIADESSVNVLLISVDVFIT